ncbi:phosphoribosylaminoimidazolesuccinocarboxamide synthase [bacterium]|nr:phosphoribosylaminoimidazolesuccinocarboxamide synthase [bacterium]
MIEKNVLGESKLSDLKFLKKGKVRDLYDFDQKLLIIATDRISCFDVILSSCIPYKGEVLTRLSAFWFAFTRDIIDNHFITIDATQFPPSVLKYKDSIRGRAMWVKKTQPLSVECVVRGYLSGSAWKEYKNKSSVCGINLPSGLKESDKLPDVLFTPSTKAEIGHDENISEKEVQKLIGVDLTQQIKEKSIALYKKGAQYAESKGIIIADTKFEFGLYEDELILIDEVLTPDSSRFWPRNEYEPGRAQSSFDKQFVRDYLISRGNLDKKKTFSVPLPEEIVQRTSRKYLDIYRIITGKDLIQ